MTALPPLARVSALAAWVGQEIPDDDPRAGAVLSAASALVRAHTGNTWVGDYNLLVDNVPEVVTAVVVQVAARVWMNPAGLTSITIDDATRRWGDAATAGLYLTEREQATLAEFSASSSPGIGTISFTRGEGYDDTVWVPTAPQPGPPFPWYAAGDVTP